MKINVHDGKEWMMEQEKSIMPVWYRLWRGLLGLTVVVMVMAVLIAMPAILTSLHITSNTSRQQVLEQVASVIGETPYILFIAIPAGLVILVAGLVIGVVATLIRSEGRRVSRGGIAKTILAFLLIAGMTAGLIVIAINGAIWKLDYTFSTSGDCLPEVRMIAFVDTNLNGVRDGRNLRLENANGTLTISHFGVGNRWDEARDFQTDATGNHQLGITRANQSIPAPHAWVTPRGCDRQQLVVRMMPVEGYFATTTTLCSVYTGQYSSASGEVVCYAGYAPVL